MDPWWMVPPVPSWIVNRSRFRILTLYFVVDDYNTFRVKWIDGRRNELEDPLKIGVSKFQATRAI